jgi:Outer membrane protein beta-barrel domain
MATRTPILLVLAFLVGPRALPADSHELDLATGYNYQNSDQGEGIRSNLNGWYASLQYDLSEMVSVGVEVDSFYGSLQGQSLRQQNYIAGPQFTFRSARARWRPFVFIQAGDQRSSSDTVTHSFDLQIGGGLQTRLNDHVSLQLIPAEYNLAIQSGTPTHSISVNFGVIWTLWKGK